MDLCTRARAGPDFSLRPEGRTFSSPRGSAFGPPFSFRRRSRHGPSGPRRKCGVRRREPAPRATRVYEIKRGPRSAVRCGEQKRWWGRKHPSWRELEVRPPGSKLSSAAHGAESSAACGAGLSLSRFRRQLPRQRAPGRGASLTPAARRSAASGKSDSPAAPPPRRIPPGWSGAANRRFPGGR